MVQHLDCCPCCGGVPKYHEKRVTYGHGECLAEWSVRCECGMQTSGSPVGWEGTEAQCKDKVAATWNRRPIVTTAVESTVVAQWVTEDVAAARVAAERDRWRSWVEEAVNYVGCETWSPSLKEEGERLLGLKA